MRNTNKSKKLALDTRTLRPLTGTDLARVGGGGDDSLSNCPTPPITHRVDTSTR
jgi:hypothetical protein